MSDVNVPDDVKFRTSSLSGAGDCVAVGNLADGQVAVRNTRGPDQVVLVFTHREWSAFVAGVKAGEFDPD